MTLDRVWAIGRDTYLRVYPNPGFGLRFFCWRVAVSWHRGVEIFRRQGDKWQLRFRRLNRKLDIKTWRS